MTWTVDWTNEATKALIRLKDRAAQTRIIEAVNRLASTGQGDVKALQGLPGEFRLRVGNYRVRFERDGQRLVILVLEVAHRREAYR